MRETGEWTDGYSKEAEEAMTLELENERKREDAILEEVRKEKGVRFLNKVKKEMDEDEGSFRVMGFTENPAGKEHESEYSRDFKVWVHQTVNGGYSGDSYSGYIYIKIQNGKYLKIQYDM